MNEWTQTWIFYLMLQKKIGNDSWKKTGTQIIDF